MQAGMSGLGVGSEVHVNDTMYGGHQTEQEVDLLEHTVSLLVEEYFLPQKTDIY